jgi:hypothetical protein
MLLENMKMYWHIFIYFTTSYELTKTQLNTCMRCYNKMSHPGIMVPDIVYHLITWL